MHSFLYTKSYLTYSCSTVEWEAWFSWFSAIKEWNYTYSIRGKPIESKFIHYISMSKSVRNFLLLSVKSKKSTISRNLELHQNSVAFNLKLFIYAYLIYFYYLEVAKGLSIPHYVTWVNTSHYIPLLRHYNIVPKKLLAAKLRYLFILHFYFLTAKKNPNQTKCLQTSSTLYGCHVKHLPWTIAILNSPLERLFYWHKFTGSFSLSPHSIFWLSSFYLLKPFTVPLFKNNYSFCWSTSVWGEFLYFHIIYKCNKFTQIKILEPINVRASLSCIFEARKSHWVKNRKCQLSCDISKAYQRIWKLNERLDKVLFHKLLFSSLFMYS